MARLPLAPGKATLRAVSDLVAPAEFALFGEPCLLGRDQSCDVVINRKSVSRQHAQIEWHGRYYVISDAGSSNGTFVNSQQITDAHRLRNMDLIGFASIEPMLQFIDHDATAIEPPLLQFISTLR